MNWLAIFTYAPFAVGALTFLVFAAAERMRTRWRAVWAMVLLLAFSKFLCFDVFGGHAFNPELPQEIIWAWDWLYSGAMILCPLAVMTVFLRGRWRVRLLPAVAWGLSAWGLYNGVRAPGVREVALEFQNLPESLDGYRIVQIADLHASCAARAWRTEAVVDAVNALSPDLICITGDNCDGRVETASRYIEPLKRLRAKDGVFGCTGNHEYYYGFNEWKAGFYDAATNLHVLCNKCVFPRPGLALAGVPDETGWQLLGLDAPPDVFAAFAAATNGEFRVLMQHRPESAPVNCLEHGVRLQLSGHTHGGIAPGLREFIARFNGGYSVGPYRIGRSWLYVSPGCGQWAGFPMRFFNPSEITLITLRLSGGSGK
ncbi:MAG: metallophosphoesterase [Kiritimatiellae bacterium]|nr:metallophosphoesterase [Kiritimatiellia bacterium]